MLSPSLRVSLAQTGELARRLAIAALSVLRSFRLRSVRQRLESIRLRLLSQFANVLKHVLQQLIHLLQVRSRSDASQSIQFLKVLVFEGLSFRKTLVLNQPTQY